MIHGMLSTDITPGDTYMVREPGSDHCKVKAIERVRAGKWPVVFVAEDPPLTDDVKAAHIICPWREHRALLRDEKRMKPLADVSNRSWPGIDHPTDRAVQWVLEHELDGESQVVRLVVSRPPRMRSRWWT